MIGFACRATVLLLVSVVLLPVSDAEAQVPRNDRVEGGILDQQYVEDFTDPRYRNAISYGDSNEYREFGQSFTAGMNGYLSHIELYGSSAWSQLVTLNVWEMDSSLPTEVVATRTLQPGNPSFRRWITFDVRPYKVRILPGDEFMISTTGRFDWIASLWQNPYLTYGGGGAYYRQLMSPGGVLPNGGNWHRLDGAHAENDLLFRTYVIPVPEPSTALLLFTLSLSTIACQRTRRR